MTLNGNIDESKKKRPYFPAQKGFRLDFIVCKWGSIRLIKGPIFFLLSGPELPCVCRAGPTLQTDVRNKFGVLLFTWGIPVEEK